MYAPTSHELFSHCERLSHIHRAPDLLNVWLEIGTPEGTRATCLTHAFLSRYCGNSYNSRENSEGERKRAIKWDEKHACERESSVIDGVNDGARHMHRALRFVLTPFHPLLTLRLSICITRQCNVHESVNEFTVRGITKLLRPIYSLVLYVHTHTCVFANASINTYTWIFEYVYIWANVRSLGALNFTGPARTTLLTSYEKLSAPLSSRNVPTSHLH